MFNNVTKHNNKGMLRSLKTMMSSCDVVLGYDITVATYHSCIVCSHLIPFGTCCGDLE